jgi:predicted phage terminase large subunit-like protein
MLLVPPRHGKSELASRRFPAFYLGHYPHRQFISASASGPLAEDFGRDVRNLVGSPEYARLFQTRLSGDSQAKGRWNTEQGGSYYAVGIGSDIMGRGAHVLLIDDPFGSMADARSEAERKAVHQWLSAAYSRLENNAAIVLINHRMHEQDLTGELLVQQAAGGDKWDVVELKAIQDDGRALWPEKYDLRALERLRANMQPADWSALYQQNPTPDQGIYFSTDWLRPYIDPPARDTLHVYGASDYAVTSDGGDYTCHIVVGVDPEERIYILDLWRARTSSDIWVETQCDMMERWRPAGWAEESGQIKLGVGPFLHKRLLERRINVVRAQFPTRGDKAIRAQSIRGRAATRGLYVPSQAFWYPDFRQELLAFPVGRNDDQVDALGLIGQVIDRMIPGRAPAPTEPDKILSTNPEACTVTLKDMWDAHERRGKRMTGGRIR